MLASSIVLIVLALGYTLSVYCVYKGWNNLEPIGKVEFKPEVSLLIAARNESARIKVLLKSIQKLHYSKQKLQIILIDDHSEDDTITKATAVFGDDLKIIRLAEGNEGLLGKKAAIETGVKQAKFDIIVTVDADSIVQPDWLGTIVLPFRDSQIQLVAGPVLYSNQPGILNQFQQLDMLANNAMAAAGFYYGQPFLCNGTNLAFRRKAFLDVNGFAGNKHLASGDDVFLLQKINVAYPGMVKYIKDAEAVVMTAPQTSLPELINQRKRWASKSTKLNSTLLAALLISGYFLHLALFLFPVWVFIFPGIFPALITGFYLKVFIEYLLISRAGRDLKTKVDLSAMFVVSLLYIPYIAIVGILGIFTHYKWKGRTIGK
jgi:poly-beta-1,6-N-acetyl-D-glucosamine synthase